MEPILFNSLTIYGPLGLMVLGLGWTVVYLWKALQASQTDKFDVLRTQLSTEVATQEKYVKLCMQLDHTLEGLAEKLSHVTKD